MALISFIQQTTVASLASGNPNPTFGGNTTVGNVVVAIIFRGGTRTVTVSGMGATWVPLVETPSTAGGVGTSIFAGIVVTPGTTLTITPSAGVSEAQLIEFSGVTLTTDGTNNKIVGTTTETSIQPGNITTINANDLVIAAAGIFNVNPITSPGAPWNALNGVTNDVNSRSTAAIYQVTTATGSFNPTFSWTGATTDGCAIVALQADLSLYPIKKRVKKPKSFAPRRRLRNLHRPTASAFLVLEPKAPKRPKVIKLSPKPVVRRRKRRAVPFDIRNFWPVRREEVVQHPKAKAKQIVRRVRRRGIAILAAAIRQHKRKNPAQKPKIKRPFRRLLGQAIVVVSLVGVRHLKPITRLKAVSRKAKRKLRPILFQIQTLWPFTRKHEALYHVKPIKPIKRKRRPLGQVLIAAIQRHRLKRQIVKAGKTATRRRFLANIGYNFPIIRKFKTKTIGKLRQRGRQRHRLAVTILAVSAKMRNVFRSKNPQSRLHRAFKSRRLAHELQPTSAIGRRIPEPIKRPIRAIRRYVRRFIGHFTPKPPISIGVRFQLLGTPSVVCDIEHTANIAAISGSPAVRATIERNVTTL